MKKHPNVGSKVETTTKYAYAFTLSDYEKYLITKLMKREHVSTDSEAIIFSTLKRILKGNRTVFKNWIPAPSLNLMEAEDKMTSLINFLDEKTNRTEIISLLKNDLNVSVKYDSSNNVSTIVTDSVTFGRLPEADKKAIDKSITKFEGSAIISSLGTTNIERDINLCRKYINSKRGLSEEFKESIAKETPDFYDCRGQKIEEKVNKEVDAAIGYTEDKKEAWAEVAAKLNAIQRPTSETKPVTQVSTYWLFGIIPIWIRRKIVTQ